LTTQNKVITIFIPQILALILLWKKKVYDPWAFYLHVTLLYQAFAHCGKFLTVASHRHFQLFFKKNQRYWWIYNSNCLWSLYFFHLMSSGFESQATQ
jgi:hypothetical protein